LSQKVFPIVGINDVEDFNSVLEIYFSCFCGYHKLQQILLEVNSSAYY